MGVVMDGFIVLVFRFPWAFFMALGWAKHDTQMREVVYVAMADTPTACLMDGYFVG